MQDRHILTSDEKEFLLFVINEGLSAIVSVEIARELARNIARSFGYSEYLKTAHWEKKRERALRLSNFRCRLCVGKKDLEVHHNSYLNIGCEEDCDLITLCKECHGEHHIRHPVRNAPC